MHSPRLLQYWHLRIVWIDSLSMLLIPEISQIQLIKLFYHYHTIFVSPIETNIWQEENASSWFQLRCSLHNNRHETIIWKNYILTWAIDGDCLGCRHICRGSSHLNLAFKVDRCTSSSMQCKEFGSTNRQRGSLRGSTVCSVVLFKVCYCTRIWIPCHTDLCRDVSQTTSYHVVFCSKHIRRSCCNTGTWGWFGLFPWAYFWFQK